jgi:site-specific recombinase XerD
MFKRKHKPAWTIDCPTLHRPFLEFILSRQGKLCTPSTLEWYRYTAGMFVVWLENKGITFPDQIKSSHVSEYIAELSIGGKTDNTCHDHARAIRTLLRFWVKDKTIPEMLEFDMPTVEKKRLPTLTAEQLQYVLNKCNVRDKSIVLTIVDSGVRRRETIGLNWGDLDMNTGLLRVRRGKGKKDRSTVVGATTRRALLKYQRELTNIRLDAPLFQTDEGQRFTSDGFIQIFHRLTERTGIYISPHALRRTFAILSLRAGMDALHLQNMGGWTSLDMVNHYAQMVDDDLLQAHRSHSAIDNMNK